jgi:hypothetical protein
MAKQYHRPPESRMTSSGRRGGNLFSLRTLAILVMVLGAAGFMFSLVAYGEQILCLLGSTIITFIGLGLTIAARRYRESQPEIAAEDNAAQSASEPQPPQEMLLPTAPRQHAGDADVHGTLAAAAVERFRREGAAVTVEAQRADRCILRIRTGDGKELTAIVLEDDRQVDVSEVRALFALIMSSGSRGGYLISQGRFTPRAREWASARRISLVDKNLLFEMD